MEISFLKGIGTKAIISTIIETSFTFLNFSLQFSFLLTIVYITLIKHI